jgi:hypothetical protein
MNTEALQKLQTSHSQFTRFQSPNLSRWVKSVLPNYDPSWEFGLIERDVLLDQQVTETLSDLDFSLLILGWGGMRRDHARRLFENQDWLTAVNAIRNGHVQSRENAYQLFYDLSNQGRIPGMGPAYYTKLICFLNPSLNGYIMDQWTAKSINHIMDVRNSRGENTRVSINTSGYVLQSNTSVTYEWFCKAIENVAQHFGWEPIMAEEYIFSNGGRKKGAWREYIVSVYQ